MEWPGRVCIPSHSENHKCYMLTLSQQSLQSRLSVILKVVLSLYFRSSTQDKWYSVWFPTLYEWEWATYWAHNLLWIKCGSASLYGTEYFWLLLYLEWDPRRGTLLREDWESMIHRLSFQGTTKINNFNFYGWICTKCIITYI